MKADELASRELYESRKATDVSGQVKAATGLDARRHSELSGGGRLRKVRKLNFSCLCK